MGRRRVRMTNKPSYRFEDYAEPWEQRKLGEIVDITSGDAPAKFFEGNTPYVKVDDLNYCDKYLTATQNHVDTSYKIKKIEKGSVVFPKRGAAILTNKIRILNVQAYMDTNMMSLNTDKANLEFLYTVISNIGLYKIADTSTIPQINNKHILPYPIFFPTLPEQTAIGSFFQEIDQLISLQQRKLEVLKEQKKTYLNLLFPTIGQKKPALRFAGFEDEWKEVKLGEILVERNEQISESEEYQLMSFVQGKGVVPKSDRYDRSFLVKDDKKNYKKTEYGDFIYSSNNLDTGSIGFNKTGKALISPVYSIFYSKTRKESQFIAILSQRKEFINEMIKYRQGVVYGQFRIHESDFLNISILAPESNEQEYLITFFQDLDKAIAKQEEKVNQLKESKQTLLRKMFI